MRKVLNDSRLGRFLVAVIAAAGAILLQFVLEPAAGPAALWLCYTGGVVMGAWYGGLKPGMVTTLILTIAAAYNLTPPPPAVQIAATDGRALAIFAIMSLAICEAMQRLRMERLRSMHAENRLREVLENTHDMVLSVDQELACTYANKRTGKVARRPSAQLVGRSLRTIFPETPGSVIYRELNRVLIERTPARFQDCVESTKRWYEFEASPSTAGINLFVRDVTDQMHAQGERAAISTVREAQQAPDGSGTGL
jgi:PAS domain S-box-containing protein